jgi:hypothetical protein
MTEVLDSSHSLPISETTTRVDYLAPRHNLQQRAVAQNALRHYGNEPLYTIPATARLKDLDQAYADQDIDRAQAILDRLANNEPYFYSSYQNRITLNQLAHPIQRHLTLDHVDDAAVRDSFKDIEAIYGRGSDQLNFLLTQAYLNHDQNPGLRAEIEGGLSELTIFLLTARSLTDETIDPYLIIPSTEAQDWAKITPDGLHHGLDFTVIRSRDNTQIPVQVKTSRTRAAQYPRDILVVYVADLVRDNNATPQLLAEALYFDINGAQNSDTSLIEAASKRLFNAFDNYRH